MVLHMQDERKDAAQPGSGSGKQKRAQAAALLYALTHDARKCGNTLFRGSHEAPVGVQSWSTKPRVAPVWAGTHWGGLGGVWELPKGARGIRVVDYLDHGDVEKEWLVLLPDTYAAQNPRTSKLSAVDLQVFAALKRVIEEDNAREYAMWNRHLAPAYSVRASRIEDATGLSGRTVATALRHLMTAGHVEAVARTVEVGRREGYAGGGGANFRPRATTRYQEDATYRPRSS
jgi:hypothetical protein